MRRVFFRAVATHLGISPNKLVKIVVQQEHTDILQALVPLLFDSVDEAVGALRLTFAAELSTDLPSDFDVDAFNLTYAEDAARTCTARQYAVAYSILLVHSQ